MDKNAFTQFRRSQIAELRPFVPGEDEQGTFDRVSISAPDRENGSPKLGDMIARNPANHDDLWLVSADYFTANFEPLASDDASPVNSEETSKRVTGIAAKFINFGVEDTEALGLEGSSDDMKQFIADVRSLAASCLTQAPDTAPVDFLTRLKIERGDLDTRLGKLAVFLGNGAKGVTPRHRDMLNEQSKLMSDLLAVLDERIADLEIERRNTVGEPIDGE